MPQPSPVLVVRRLLLSGLILVLSLFGGALGYKLLFPEASWARCVFMTAITLSTVGFGDLLGVEHHDTALWFTIGLMGIGMGAVVYAISTVTAIFVDGHLKDIVRSTIMRHRISRMRDHYIICGVGHVGAHVARELYTTKRAFVAVEADEDQLLALRRELPELPCILGDASTDEILREAGVTEARGLVAALPSDKDNLFLTVTAKLLNPKLKIASKAIDTAITPKLRTAGADAVVCPNLIGGLRIASELVRPRVVTFLDSMLRGRDESVRLEEVVVPERSRAAGKPLARVRVYEEAGVFPIALRRLRGAAFVYNPSGSESVETGDAIVFIGTPEQRQKVEALVAAQ